MKDKLIVFVTRVPSDAHPDWPVGERALIDEHGVVEKLPDDHPVQYWVCHRVDEPWTWKILSNQHTGTQIFVTAGCARRRVEAGE